MPARPWNLKRLRTESSYWRSAMLLTAAHLDLFGWIGKRKKSPRDLATHFGGSATGWEIFLNALCGMGLMRKHGGKYANSVFAARCLSGGGDASLLPAYDAWNIWGGLIPALTLGKRPALQRPFVSDRSKAERLLHSLDLDAQPDRTPSYREIAVETLAYAAGYRRRIGKFLYCVLSPLSASASDPRRTSPRSSSGASSYRRIRYGQKSANCRRGFITRCSTQRI